MKKQCLYCENTTDDTPHFQSGCCKRGMCEECYQNLVGTDRQIQLDFWETDNDKDEAIKEKYKRMGYGYVCFDCEK